MICSYHSYASNCHRAQTLISNRLSQRDAKGAVFVHIFERLGTWRRAVHGGSRGFILSALMRLRERTGPSICYETPKGEIVGEVVMVGAERSPIGKRYGSLSTLHSADVLATVLKSLYERTGYGP